MGNLQICQVAGFDIFALIQSQEIIRRDGKEVGQTDEHIDRRLDIIIFQVILVVAGGSRYEYADIKRRSHVITGRIGFIL